MRAFTAHAHARDNRFPIARRLVARARFTQLRISYFALAHSTRTLYKVVVVAAVDIERHRSDSRRRRRRRRVAVAHRATAHPAIDLSHCLRSAPSVALRAVTRPIS